MIIIKFEQMYLILLNADIMISASIIFGKI